MTRIATFVAAAALIAPSSALGSSTCQAYSSQLCAAVSGANGNSAASTKTTGATNASAGTNVAATAGSTTGASAAQLPFTGIDVGLLAAGGVTLLGTGLVVRRLSRRQG